MAIRDSKDKIPVFLAIFSLIFVADSVQGLGILLTNEEVMDLDRQLKLINKPALKSFQTEYGDIVDCIDIYKQLAFDHPLLNNHTIQMKPKTTAKEAENEAASTVYKSSQYMAKNIKCPPGSVPIKRATREDLIVAKSMKSLGPNYPTNTPYNGVNVNTRGYHSAVLEHTSGNFGARARISIWNPTVKENQFSSGGMWLVNGSRDKRTSIQTGWIVQKSGECRLYTYWTADAYQNTGCFNTLCPGFVQVNPDIALGLVLPHSIVNGSQFDVLLSLYLDQGSGHWWLMFEDKYVGYWPKIVIPMLGGGARFVSWGGEVYSPLNVPSPAMGSGNFPIDAFGVNHGKTAYVGQIKVVTDPKDSTRFEDPQLEDIKIWADKPVCYNARKFVDDVPGWGFQVYFGGPGNCTY